MADVAPNSAAHDDDANAVVTRTRLVVAKHFAVMRIKSLLQVHRRRQPDARSNASPTWLDAAAKELVRLGFPWGAAAAAARPRTCRPPATERLILRGRTLPEDAAEQIGDILGTGLPQNAGAVALDGARAQMYAPGDLLVGQT